MKQTREEVIKALAITSSHNLEMVEADQVRRKEFARCFAWAKKRGQFDYGDDEPRTPTWMEIFVEVGKLLANQDFAENHTQMHDFDYRITKLENPDKEVDLSGKIWKP